MNWEGRGKKKNKTEIEETLERTKKRRRHQEDEGGEKKEIWNEENSHRPHPFQCVYVVGICVRVCVPHSVFKCIENKGRFIETGKRIGGHKLLKWLKSKKSSQMAAARTD